MPISEDEYDSHHHHHQVAQEATTPIQQMSKADLRKVGDNNFKIVSIFCAYFLINVHI